ATMNGHARLRSARLSRVCQEETFEVAACPADIVRQWLSSRLWRGMPQDFAGRPNPVRSFLRKWVLFCFFLRKTDSPAQSGYHLDATVLYPKTSVGAGAAMTSGGRTEEGTS